MEHPTAFVALTADMDAGHPSAGQPDSVAVYTVEEAAHILRISRSSGYALARRYFATDGREGLPVLRVGNCLRVPAWALQELLRTGRVVRLIASEHNSDGGGRKPAAAGSSRAGPGSRRGRRREGAATGRKETVEQLVLIRDE